MQEGRFPLARSATIVSFDEAKRTSREARSRSRRGQDVPVEGRPLAFFDPGADARFSVPSRRGRSAAQSASSRPSRSARPAAAASAASRHRQAPSWYDGPDERALRAEQARRAQVRKEAQEIEDDEQAKKATPAQKLRKLVAKRKADKVFGAEGSASAGEGGPRAAVYKGEMGSSQRRASRMQDASAAEVEGRRSRRGRHFSFGPKMRIAAAVLGCLALVCVFLYQPAQRYYSAMRENAALEAEYAALQQRDEALQDSVSALSTDAGMEDLARDQFGWVKEGEVAVSVSGIEADSSTGSSVPPNVSAGSVDPPDTWYSGILDPIFGVE